MTETRADLVSPPGSDAYHRCYAPTTRAADQPPRGMGVRSSGRPRERLSGRGRERPRRFLASGRRMTATGKIQKSRLREPYWTGHDRRIN